MSVIIFDTETFGTITSLDNKIQDIDEWPKIKQICWQTFDLNGNLLNTNNYYFELTQNNIKEVLKKFTDDFQNSKLTIAHNFLFDFKVISAELIRHNLPLNLLENKTMYDTMHSNIELCGIKNEYGHLKYPTLSELHFKLFETNFEGAHDAKNDVIATAKCFWHLRFNSKIDFDKLPNVKEEIQFREEKLLEEISTFYSSRKQFGDYLFNACELGIIGEIIKKEEENIRLNRQNNKNELNIYSNSKLLIEWILELEKVFINCSKNKQLFSDYVEYKSLNETMSFLKNRSLYFPKNSMKFEEEFAIGYLSNGIRFDKTNSMKLYNIIGNMINKYEFLENIFREKQKELTKNNSGCVLFLGFITAISTIIYFT